MRFEHPSILYLLLALPLAMALVHRLDRSRHKALQAWATPSRWTQLGIGLGSGGRLRAVCLWSALALAVLAAARPQLGYRTQVRRTRAIDWVAVLDLSRSMQAEDVQPSRLARARLEIQRLIDAMPGQRVGLVGYTSVALPLSPLTVDGRHVRLQLERADPGLMPRGGTRLAEGLREGRAMLERVEGAADRAMVVFTDGEDHGGGAIEAARAAREAGVEVHVVGIGGTEGEPIPVRDASGRRTGYVQDAQGRTVLSAMNPDVLRRTAEAGGGRLILAENGGLDLSPLLERLAELKRSELETRTTRVYVERYRWFLLPALLLLFLATWRVPRRSGALALTAAWLLLSPSIGGAQVLTEEDDDTAEGRSALDAGDTDRALEAFGRAQARLDLPQAHLNAGLALARAGKTEEALDALARAEARGDARVASRAAYAAGNLLRKSEEYEQAEAAYRRALLQDPELDGARRNLEITRGLRLRAPPPPPPQSGSQEDEETSDEEEANENRPQEGQGQSAQQDDPSREPGSDDPSEPPPEDSESGASESQAGEGKREDEATDPGSDRDSGEPTDSEASSAQGDSSDASQTDPSSGNEGSAAPMAQGDEEAIRALLEGLRQQERTLLKELLQRQAQEPSEPVRKDW